MKGFVSFYFTLCLRLYFEEVLSFFSNTQWSIWGLMKEFPSPWSPVAVFHSNKSCCKLRTMCHFENGSRVFSACPGHCCPVGAHLLTLLCSLTRWHFDDWLDVLMSYEGWATACWEPWSGPEVQRCLSFVPSSSEVLKGLKGEVVVVCFGRTFLPKGKLHFLLNPLLSWAVGSPFSLRPLKKWVDQARVWPLDSASEGALWFGSGKPHHPRVLREAGQMASFALVCPLMHVALESSAASSKGPCGASGFLTPVCQEIIVMDVCQVPCRCSTLSCPCHCLGEFGGDLALIPLKS